MKVLITLGNILNDDGSISKMLEGRLTLTLRVMDNYDRVILTGGFCNRTATRPEAEAMREWLVAHGADESKLVLEDKSYTTAENAQFCAPILRALGADEVTVLSSASHIERSFLNPVDLFLEHTGYAVKTIKAEP